MADPEHAPHRERRAGSNDAPKLVLASEALREDIAPLHPAERESRLIFSGIAIGLALEGIALSQGLGPGSEAGSVAFAMAGATAAAVALPFPYVLRAGVAVLLGALMMFFGARGVGPLGGIAAEGIVRDVTRLGTMSVLPAALLFRAKYRAYRPARFVLAGAMVLAIPFLAVETILLTDATAPFLMRAAGVVDVVMVLCGLFGFMGGYTTGAGSVWAALLLWVLTADLALRDLTNRASEPFLYTTAAVGTLGAAVLVSVGIFQLLSAALAPDARRVSLKTASENAHASPA
jgi:hypothetical protein